jgi:hypothetical protein
MNNSPIIEKTWGALPEINLQVYGQELRTPGIRYNNSRSAHSEIIKWNTPESERVSNIAEGLSNIINEWASTNVIQLPSEQRHLLEHAWKSFKNAISATSATDLILGWGEDGNELVQRPGRRANSRRQEIEKLSQKIEFNSDLTLNWKETSYLDRIQVSGLMLLASMGLPLEAINRISSVIRTPFAIARILSVVEKNYGSIVFTGESKTLLEQLISFGQIEEKMLLERGLTKLTLVEGKRKAIYVPQDWALPSQDVFSRIHKLAEITHIDTDLTMLAQKLTAKYKDPNQAIAAVLLDCWQSLSDESIIITRKNNGPAKPGDEIASWSVISGRVFKYEAKIVQTEDGLKVEGIENSLVRIESNATMLPTSWRRQLSTLNSYPDSTQHSIKNIRQRLIEIENIDQTLEHLHPTLNSDLRHAAKYLFKRQIDYNLTQVLTGWQQGTSGIQPGWHLAWDISPTKVGYGPLNNPGHAQGGVQTMIRMPILGTKLSNFRIWRETGDEDKQYKLRDIPASVAYRNILEALCKIALYT